MDENDTIEENLSEGGRKSKKKFWLMTIIILIVGGAFLTYLITMSDFSEEVTPPVYNISFEKFVCTNIRIVPTWISKIGIVDEGFTNFPKNLNPKITVDLLINAQVFFVYHSDCAPCKDQIGYFGTEWGRYVNSGYTINCKDIL